MLPYVRQLVVAQSLLEQGSISGLSQAGVRAECEDAGVINLSVWPRALQR
jgi:hypothetical protein